MDEMGWNLMEETSGNALGSERSNVTMDLQLERNATINVVGKDNSPARLRKSEDWPALTIPLTSPSPLSFESIN